jgi:dihydrofolate reductase
MKISIIVAADEQNGIGKNNQLLCHLPADLKYFKTLTTNHAILMGRKTYESIGKPLPNRTNIIISKTANKIEGCFVFNTIEDGIEFARSLNEENLFIIGGDSIYKQSLSMCDTIYLTRIHHQFEADSFFPELNKSWKLI